RRRAPRLRASMGEGGVVGGVRCESLVTRPSPIRSETLTQTIGIVWDRLSQGPRRGRVGAHDHSGAELLSFALNRAAHPCPNECRCGCCCPRSTSGSWMSLLPVAAGRSVPAAGKWPRQYQVPSPHWSASQRVGVGEGCCG